MTNANDVTILGDQNRFVEFDKNGRYGILLDETRNIETSLISASTNAAAGLKAKNSDSFTDTGSSFISNGDHGVNCLISITTWR